MQSSSLRRHHHHHPPLLRFRTIRRSAPANHLKLHPTPPLHHHRLQYPSRRALPRKPMQSPRAHSSSSDLAPVPPSRRTFTALDMASLWVGLVVGVPSYYLAGSLVALGMAWWQGVATVVAANFVVLLLLVLTGVPGAKYGIPFPVLARSSFGVRGAHVPALLRALVGCGWYGIESWIGGEAVFLLLPPSLKSSPALLAQIPWLGTSALEFSCFAVFWLVQLGIIWGGMEGIRELEKYSAPVLLLLTSCLACWAYVRAGGFGRMLSLTSRLSPDQFWPVFFPSLSANVSFWAPVALNIPDFTRYARSQEDQLLGQLGLPVLMGLFTFVGLAVTSSTEAIFGRVISDPVRLLGRLGGGAPAAFLAIFGVGLATVTTNVAANVVAPANALASLSPSAFGFRRGALATALLGAAFQPWRLLRSSESFVYTWLLGYSALVGPIGGVVLADYYLVKGAELDVGELYSDSPLGRYYYRKGFNVAAMAALVAGMLPVVPGFLHKLGVLSDVGRLSGVLYSNAWFVSFFVGGSVYWLITALERIWKREESS